MPNSVARSQSASISTSGCPMDRPGGCARICGFSNTDRASTKALRPPSNRDTRSVPLNSRLMLLDPPMLPEKMEPLEANVWMPAIPANSISWLYCRVTFVFFTVIRSSGDTAPSGYRRLSSFGLVSPEVPRLELPGHGPPSRGIIGHHHGG